jgi:16S rRNA (adenine(1408)-N(1))-methyltransferase
VHIDLGSGDGRGPYRWAALEPMRLFIATDANPDTLVDTAWKAGRKSARGGVSNLLCISEPLEILATELPGIADRITVILPWGSLLKVVAAPEVDSMRQIARLCGADASVEIAFTYDTYDAQRTAPLGESALNDGHVIETLPRLYEEAGLRVRIVEKLTQHDLAAYQTTWAKRLAFGRPRVVWRLSAVPAQWVIA